MLPGRMHPVRSQSTFGSRIEYMHDFCFTNMLETELVCRPLHSHKDWSWERPEAENVCVI